MRVTVPQITLRNDDNQPPRHVRVPQLCHPANRESWYRSRRRLRILTIPNFPFPVWNEEWKAAPILAILICAN
jgi:hypothetical protein